MSRRLISPSVRARRIAAFAILVLIVGLMISGGLWLREQAIATADAGLRTQELALARGDSPTGQTSIAVDADSQPRLLLTDAIYRTRALQFVPPRDRDYALSTLSRQIDLAIAARPHWGQAWVVKAYIESLRTGPDHQQASLVALSRSYSDASFLRDASGWRVLYGIYRWDSLDPFVRNHVIEEATWLVRIDHSVRKTIFAAARITGAYQPLILRWREMRLTDSDYYAPRIVGNPAPTP